MVLPDDDLDLVAKARAGDLDAFGALVTRHQHRLVSFVRLMTSSAQDRDAAEDVAQEAFLRAYRALGQFRGQSTFRTWLYQIATNVARTQSGRRRDRKESQEPEAPHQRAARSGSSDVVGKDPEFTARSRPEIHRLGA